MTRATRHPAGHARQACLAVLCAALLATQVIPTPTAAAAAAPAPAAPQANPSVVGQWSAPFDLGVVLIHTHVLPNGKVLFWTRQLDAFGGANARDFSVTYVWDPATGGITSQPFNSTTNLFCSGHAFLPDGRLLVTGGHDGADGRGEPDTNFYDFNTNSWSLGPAMNAGRWYPTNVALGNGELLVASGLDANGAKNNQPQVWQTSGGWRPLGSAPDPFGDLYPWLHAAPNARVFHSGPGQATNYLRTSGAGQWIPADDNNAGHREYGGSVMYDDGLVFIAGGGGGSGVTLPKNSAEVINLNREPQLWRSVNPMVYGRRHMNTTLLADGQVLVTGGTGASGFNNASGAVLPAEMWNPATESWATMASMQTPRLYHSTAVLLPDGRVLVGGGGYPAGEGADFNHTDIEIYSPPYLFKGARPSITSAPASVNHGEQFFVGTPEATSISKITWVRLSSVTHAFNQNQRISHLNFSQAAGGLNVTAPGSGNLCPPGHYMMFLVNSNGVPSVARTVKVTVPPSPSNAIDDQRYFVRVHYNDYLNREPDGGGLNAWTNYILACGNDAACRQTRRITTARGFMESSEFRRRVGGAFFPASPGPGPTAYNQEYVRQCYIVYLKRNPGNVADPSNEAYGWYNYLSSTGNYDTTIHGFIYAGEYRNRFYKP